MPFCLFCQSPVYNREDCLYFCRLNDLARTCGCIDSYDQFYSTDSSINNASLRFCDNFDPIQRNCRINVEFKSQNGLLDCPCPHPCTSVMFTTQQSLTEWPGETYAPFVVNRLLERSKSTKVQSYLKSVLTAKGIFTIIYFQFSFSCRVKISSKSYPLQGAQTEVTSDWEIFERPHVHSALQLHGLEKASILVWTILVILVCSEVISVWNSSDQARTMSIERTLVFQRLPRPGPRPGLSQLLFHRNALCIYMTISQQFLCSDGRSHNFESSVNSCNSFGFTGILY